MPSSLLSISGSTLCDYPECGSTVQEQVKRDAKPVLCVRAPHDLHYTLLADFQCSSLGSSNRGFGVDRSHLLHELDNAVKFTRVSKAWPVGNL